MLVVFAGRFGSMIGVLIGRFRLGCGLTMLGCDVGAMLCLVVFCCPFLCTCICGVLYIGFQLGWLEVGWLNCEFKFEICFWAKCLGLGFFCTRFVLWCT